MTLYRRFQGGAAKMLADDQAVSATEYAVLLALLVLVAVATINQIGGKIMNLYTAIDGTIPVASP